MASSQKFWEGFEFLIIGVILSIILVLFVGVAVDGVITQMESIDVLNVQDPWGSAAATDIYFWQKYAYMVAISPAILGVIAQIVAAVARERVEEEQEFYGTSYGEEEAI